MTELAERVAAVEQRVSDHEGRCEERLGEIKITAASTLKAVEGVRGRIWAIVIALLAWALAQVWTTQTDRMDRLEARPAAAATVDVVTEGKR